MIVAEPESLIFTERRQQMNQYSSRRPGSQMKYTLPNVKANNYDVLESDEEVNEFQYEYMDTINGTDRRVVETKLAQYQKSPRAKTDAQVMKSGDDSID